MAIACRRNDERWLRRAVSHMTRAMTKGMTKPMTKAAASVEQFARLLLRFGFELRPPVAKRLERKPLSLTITLVDSNRFDATPRGAFSKMPRRNARETIFRPPFYSSLQIRPVGTDRVRQAQNNRANQWTLTSLDHLIEIPCYASKIP